MPFSKHIAWQAESKVAQRGRQAAAAPAGGRSREAEHPGALHDAFSRAVFTGAAATTVLPDGEHSNEERGRYFEPPVAAAASGAPLPASLQGKFEDSLGVDLARVSVHTGPDSATSARALEARAYTSGRDIHFGAGQFNPESRDGQRLLAHEVAHTAQQTRGGEATARKAEVSDPGDVDEREADSVAYALVEGRPVSVCAVAAASGRRIAREASPAATPAPTPTVSTATDKSPDANPARPPTASPADPKLVTFCKTFQEKFANIIKAFGGTDAVTPTMILDLLSTWQRKQLADFFDTGIIPDGLFTDAQATGRATVAQRVLMSAQILSTGKRLNKDGPNQGVAEKPHALFCGHWVQYVWSYAGVNAAKGMDYANQGSQLDVVGPTGQVSFGGGKIGFSTIMPTDTDPASPLYKRRPPIGSPNPSTMASIFDLLQPGDWIYIDNGKEQGHSLVFVGWEDDTPQAVTTIAEGRVVYKKAKVYSQRDNTKTWNKAGGGDPHGETLGFPYSGTLGVHPVTAITRPDATSGPPRTVEQLLQFDRKKAAEKNLAIIAANKVSISKVHLRVSVEAYVLLHDAPELKHLETAQRQLCDDILAANNTPTIDAISTLIALGQRLSFAKVVDGVLNPSNKQDAALLGAGGLKGVQRDDEPKKGARLEFPLDLAIEENRHYTKMRGVNPAKLAPLVAVAVREQLATVKVKDKMKLEAELAKEHALYDTDKTRFNELFELYQNGTDLTALSQLIALWQFLKGQSTNGWTDSYESIVGKEKLKSIAS